MNTAVIFTVEKLQELMGNLNLATKLYSIFLHIGVLKVNATPTLCICEYTKILKPYFHGGGTSGKFYFVFDT